MRTTIKNPNTERIYPDWYYCHECGETFTGGEFERIKEHPCFIEDPANVHKIDEHIESLTINLKVRK